MTTPDFNEMGSIPGEEIITDNPFYAGEKPIQPHMKGRETVPGTVYGGQNPNTVHPDSLYGANFGMNSPKWGSKPTLGSEVSWDEIRNAFVSQVLDEFGDMLHKADPHVAGLLALRVFMDKVMK